MAAHPHTSKGLGVHYANVSRLMADRGDWLAYDMGFRKMIERGLCVWGDTHSAMYQKALPKFNAPNKKQEIHTTQQKHNTTQQKQKSVPQGWCIDFHSKSECSRTQCRFNHKCFLCGIEHPAISCDKKNQHHSFRKNGGQGRKATPQ